MSDLKQALTSGTRVELTQIPRSALVYTARGLGYGSDKYARSNFYGAPPPGVTELARLLGYIDATMRHLTRVADAINRAIGTGGDVVAAASTVDDDGGGKFPPSMLPDLAHALASLAIGVECGTNAGLLPVDPGQPWTKHPMYAAVLARRNAPAESLAQKDDPDAERRRVETLRQTPLEAAVSDALDHYADQHAANVQASVQASATLIETRVVNGAFDVVPLADY